MLVSLVKIGRIAPRSPELSSEVVVASRIVFVGASAALAASSPANAATSANSHSRMLLMRSTVRRARCGGADHHGQTDQHEPEAERQRQIALAGFEHNRCRHRAGLAGDIA